jgi:2-keto-4-pentenoate hydratase
MSSDLGTPPAATDATPPTIAEETDAAVVAAVQRLAEAAATGVPCAPVRDLIARDDVARAYRIQSYLIGAELARGDRWVGRKIGLTSLAVQAQLGVDQPDFGTLLESMTATPDVPVPAGRLLQPKIEAEVAFVLGADITDSDPSLETVTAAVATAHPALEIVASRVAGWDISLADTVADNASSGMFVIGEAALPLAEVDPVAIEMSMTQDGEVVSTGNGAACLGNPLIALQWLARVAVEVGDPLRAGEIILSGALGPMVPVQPGATYAASLTGLGDVSAVFAPSTDTGGTTS